MFKKAVKKQVKLKLALTGPSGSGKTLSSLYIAKGMGGKVAVIDTENGSASLYADRKDVPEFDTYELTPPYTTEKFIQAINEAVKNGYDILVIDSGSHQWAGDGGILNRKEQLDQKPGTNSYTNWGKFTPEHELFKSSILNSEIHLIMTLRSKQDYVLQTNDKGKQAPIKVGFAPIQRDSFEYEFSAVLDIDMTHTAESSKDRTGLFDGKRFKITEETGKQLRLWLQSGASQDSGGVNKSDPPSPASPDKPIGVDGFSKLVAYAERNGLRSDVFMGLMRTEFGDINGMNLTVSQAKTLQQMVMDAKTQSSQKQGTA